MTKENIKMNIKKDLKRAFNDLFYLEQVGQLHKWLKQEYGEIRPEGENFGETIMIPI
jgi:hypothetical protein